MVNPFRGGYIKRHVSSSLYQEKAQNRLKIRGVVVDGAEGMCMYLFHA
jgi:hypothetical protein